MRRSLGALALCLVASTAAAKPGPRFHRLTTGYVKQLDPLKQRTVSAVAELRSATAFVVAHDPQPTARALVLTNHHVAGKGVQPGEPLRFLDGTLGRTERLLAANPELDYALVEVSLPWGAKAFALPLRPGKVVPNRPIYAAAAFANLRFNPMDAAVAGGPAEHAAIARGPGNDFALAFGRTHPTNTAPITINVPAGQLTAFLSRLPNSPGMSGSPVLSRDSRGVIGLHTSGNGKPSPWEESAVPVGEILQDLRAKAPSMDADAQRLVDQIFIGAR